MSVAAFLSELRSRDIQVSAVGGELRCSARPGVLTPELRDELRRRKSEILDFLASAQALASEQRAIVPLQPSGERPPVFGVPGHNGDVFCYRALARSIGPDQPFYGLQPPGLDGQGEPLTRIEDLAAYFASQIRVFASNGPYIIAGYCAGGTVAFELSQQLVRAGAAVSFLALFGSPHPAFFRLPSQLRLRVAHQAERLAQHAQALAFRSWTEARDYLTGKLQQRKERRHAVATPAEDTVLERRARVEEATLQAVRRYKPSRFAGRVELFLPARKELPNSIAALRWQDLAQQFAVHFGAENCDGYTMLLEPTAPAFAELFRRSRDGAHGATWGLTRLVLTASG